MELDDRERQTMTNFHGYRILGQTEITDAKTKSDLLSALYDGLDRGDFMACINPRHAIRAVRRGKTVDLVVCFECLQIEVYDARGDHTVTVSDSARDVFNRILSRARVPQAAP